MKKMDNSYFLGRKLQDFVYETTFSIFLWLYGFWKENAEATKAAAELEEGMKKVIGSDSTDEDTIVPPPPKNSKEFCPSSERLSDLEFPLPAPKRQKIFDFEEERVYDTLKNQGDIPQNIRTLVYKLYAACPFPTPSK